MKQGFMFSTVAIIIVAIAIAISMQQAYVVQQEQPMVTTPIFSANSFLNQLSQDFSRAVHITGYRGLIGLEEYISSSGSYVDDVDVVYLAMMINGSLNGTSYDIMDDTTLTDFTSRIQELASQRGIFINLTINDLEAKHVSAFDIQLTVDLVVNASLADGQTSWNYQETVSSIFSIDSLKDPLHTVGSLGRVPVTIQENNVSRPFITGANNTDALLSVFNNSYYVANTNAPSFLMRFSGNLSESPYGISSLVNTPDHDEQGLTVKSAQSIVDYVYYGASTSSYRIINTPSYIRLDDNNLETYDAEDKTI